MSPDANRSSQRQRDFSRERAEILREVMEDQAQKSVARSKRTEPKSGRGTVTNAVYVVILAVCSYIWIGSPSWVSAEGPPPPTLEQEEDALRLAMYIQAQQIENFRRQNDRIPSTLAEVGPPMAGMHFQRLGPAAYRLTGEGDHMTLVYSSSQSLAEFVGDAEDLLNPGAARR